MAFFSAALGQAAITGVCVGLLIGEPLNAPYGGMFGFCLLSALAMVYAKRRAKLPPDTLIGVFLALTLGLGLCLLVAVTRQFNVHQVEAVLFGSLLTVTDADLALLVVAGVVHCGPAAPPLQRSAARQPEHSARHVARGQLGVSRIWLRDCVDGGHSRQLEDDRRAPRGSARRGARRGGEEHRLRHAGLPGVERARGARCRGWRACGSRPACSCRPAARWFLLRA